MLTFEIKRIPKEKHKFKLVFSKELTNSSALTVLETIDLKIDRLDNTNNQSYNYQLEKLSNNKNYLLTLSNFTIEI